MIVVFLETAAIRAPAGKNAAARTLSQRRIGRELLFEGIVIHDRKLVFGNLLEREHQNGKAAREKALRDAATTFLLFVTIHKQADERSRKSQDIQVKYKFWGALS